MSKEKERKEQRETLASIICKIDPNGKVNCYDFADALIEVGVGTGKRFYIGCAPHGHKGHANRGEIKAVDYNKEDK